MQRSANIFLILLLALAAGFGLGTAARAADDTPQTAIYRGVLPVAHFDVSPPLAQLARQAGSYAPDIEDERADDPKVFQGELGTDLLGDTVTQSFSRASNLPAIPSPLVSFDGPSNPTTATPPDPVGDVGPNHYVLMYNSQYAVYNKSGLLLIGPANINTIWAGFGGACETENSGDPVVLYDPLADRWLLTQFTSAGPTFFNCVALSQTADPTGSYYRWAFTTGTNFPDYPKYGVWPDAYYIATREFAGSPFAGIGAYALDRAQMVLGNPSPTVVSFLAPPGATPYNVGDGLQPTDLDGATSLPPAGMPNLYLGTMDLGGPYGAPQDAITVWKFHVDFVTTSNSTFTLTDTLPTAPFDSIFSGCAGRSCIPQPGTTNKLDILSYRQRPLHRAAYRNFGAYQSIVTNQSAEAGNESGMAGIRWYEIRNPDTTPTIFQQGTYAPGLADGIHRWMGSAAMDKAGNLAVGYSASSASVAPGIRYTGRLAVDQAGVLPRGEGIIQNGVGSQNGSSQRWGDYTSLNVDPTDECTFWYVNEYLPASSASGWRMHVGAFKFDECGVDDFMMAAYPAAQTVCAGTDAVYTVNVAAVGTFSNQVTFTPSGNPAGTTTLLGANPVSLPASTTLTVQNTNLATAGTSTITIAGAATASVGRSSAVDLTIVSGTPSASSLTSPANAAINVAIRPTFTWTVPSQGAGSYLIEVDDDPGFGSPAYTATVNAPTATPSADLLNSTVYHWRVTATNACGVGSVSTVSSFTTVAAPGTCNIGDGPFEHFFQGFEFGAGGWTSSGTGNTWAQSSARVHSGSFSWKAVDPATQSDQQLVTPSVTLPTGESPLALIFWNHQTFESNGAAACWDGGILEISVNGGGFTQITAGLLSDPYNGPFSGGNPLGTVSAWCGDPQDWTRSVIDLAPYAGQPVRFRFRTGSDTSVGREGWYIDDVTVQGCVTGLIFQDGFEVGTTARWSSVFP